METSNGAVDDTGSGWLEVKKKHRSSSRFPLQGWVFGSSGKQSFQGSRSAQIKDGNSLMKHVPDMQKPRVVSNAQSQQSPANSTRNENEGVDVVCLSDTRDTNSDSPLSKETVCTFEEDRNVEVPLKLKCDVRHKIKWGDLDDELILKHGRKVKEESKLCGPDQDVVMVCTTPGINENYVSDDSSGKLMDSATGQPANLLSHGNSRSESMEFTFTLTSEDANTSQQFPAPEDEVSGKGVKKLKEVFSTDTKELPSPQKFDQSDNGLYGIQNHPEPIEPVSGNLSVAECPSIEITETVQLSVSNNRMVCTTSMPHENIDEMDSSQESKLPGESSGIDIHREPQSTSSMGTAEYTVDGALQEDVSKTVLTNGTGKGTASESKERFRQRLWCFLFENLNRAIDELYLLCELECDVQQMKEAIIVLEEAASDFKELNSRVQDFESPKRLSSEVVDGLPVAVMSDHRRPHALSWEVRRMTTSLHGAEILSSSLEAFRKIQKERNASYLTNQMTEVGPSYYTIPKNSNDIPRASGERSGNGPDSKESTNESKMEMGGSHRSKGTLTADRKNIDRGKTCNLNPAQTTHLPSKASSLSNPSASKSVSVGGKCRGFHGSRELELSRKDKALAENMSEKTPRFLDQSKVNNFSDKEKEKRFSTSSKHMDAWKEKRNWGDILSCPFRGSSRASYNPGMSRKSAERARVLHDKLMSPDKRKKTTTDLKREAEEKHARALRIRSELETERVQKLQRSSEKFNRVNEWQADRSTKLREVLHARHQRSVSRHEAHLAQVVRRAGDESSKVNEVRFITSLNEENKKLVLRQKLHDSEIRRAEKLQVIKIKQKEDMAREEAVLERRKILEAEKLQRLAEIQRKKEEAQIRREEERIASNAAREAKAIEQQRKKEIRAKAQQEESELLAQKLAERLAESEQRRKVYLEQIRERASMDLRDQSSPFMRRLHNKDSQGRSTFTTNLEDCQSNIVSTEGKSTLVDGNIAFQSSMKRRIKKLRQRLMALKHEIPELLLWSNENTGIGYRTTVGTVRAKIGRWLQELQRLRQARKGAGAIGLIITEIIKYVEGKELELHACRQAGLLDFIASALPASHSSKPDACLVTVYFLRLLKVVMSLPSNKSYFLAQNLLPPIIPMLAAVIEMYTKIAASVNAPGYTTPLSSRTSVESLDSISEILDSFLLIVTLVIGFAGSDESQLQMQGELVELVTAYQVVHRLRDLFALYDRPQVEGSPFPSSIILSINLLNVLTSRCAITSSINLDISSLELVANDNCRMQLAAFDESCTSLVGDSVGDHRPSSLVATSTTVITVSGVVEDRSAEEDMKFMDNDESGLENKDTESGPPVFGSGKNVDTLKVTELQKDMADSTTLAAGQNIDKISKLKPPTAFLLSVISENGLVSLPSLLTAVLLQANSKQSSEQNSYVLPSNFEEVATGVLKVLNNLALIDITFLQKMLSRPDLKMEFFHLMSFLLSHCASKWKVATDQVGLLLIESLSLLGYFALFHPGNQAVLRWGKSPTILHKVCDLPFVFFSDPKLMPVLAGTLIASCYGCEQNKVVVQLELSVDMVVSLLRACKNDLLEPQGHASSTVKHVTDDSQIFQVDSSLRSSRSGTKSSRLSLGKSGAMGRTGKARNQKEGKAFRSSEDMSQKQKSPLWETCSPLMLHRRFQDSFLEKAEQFFSVDCSQD